MKTLYFLVILLVINVCGCASGTWICSVPDKVKVVAPGGKLMGVTPYYYWDRNFSGMEMTFLLKNEGYKDKEVIIKKDRFFISRVFFPPVLALPWVMGYEDEYYFELEKIQNPANGN